MANKLFRSNNCLPDCVLSLSVVGQNLLLLLQMLFGDLNILSTEQASVLRSSLSIFLVLLSMRWILERRFMLFIKSSLFILTIFALNILLFSDNYEYLMNDGAKFLFFVHIPIFLGVVSIRNYALFLKISLWTSYICAFIGLLYMYLYLTNKLPGLEAIYNMSYGYGLLFPILLLLYLGGKMNYLLSLFLFFCVLLLGSRGPILSILIFFIIKLLFFSSIKKKTLFLVFSLLLIIMIPFIVNYIVGTVGVRSRTLSLLLNGEISQDSGRENITSFVWNKILEQPVLGYGLFGDRVFLNGAYCHNLFLEIFVNFGIPLSLCILVCLFLWGCSTYRKSSAQKRLFIILSICASILPLFVSSSYLINYMFPFFWGVIFVFSEKKPLSF